ncbi:MAG: type II secretion system protein [Campylobacterales bacterium]
MKRGFTMIELIFVIVILGILASVAVPKLMATREDAKVATITQMLNSAAEEIVSYYTARGRIEDNASQMSSIINQIEHNPKPDFNITDTNTKWKYVIFSVGGDDCVKFNWYSRTDLEVINYHYRGDSTLCNRVTDLMGIPNPGDEKNYTLEQSQVVF